MGLCPCGWYVSAVNLILMQAIQQYVRQSGDLFAACQWRLPGTKLEWYLLWVWVGDPPFIGGTIMVGLEEDKTPLWTRTKSWRRGLDKMLFWPLSSKVGSNFGKLLSPLQYTKQTAFFRSILRGVACGRARAPPKP